MSIITISLSILRHLLYNYVVHKKERIKATSYLTRYLIIFTFFAFIETFRYLETSK